MSYEFLLKNIDSIITPVLMIGLDGTIKMINRAFVEAAHLNHPSSYFVGKKAENLFGTDFVASCMKLANNDQDQKGNDRISFNTNNKMIEKVSWDMSVAKWLGDDMSDGVLLSFKEVGRDYSQTKEYRFMDDIINGTRDAIVIMTGDYRVKKVNQTFLELFGGKPEDYLKHNLREFVFEFDRFQEETKQSVQGMSFHSVFRRQDNEPVNCETVARCYPASMFASSEQSGVSEVYWILELRALAEKDNRIVEVLSGKIRMLEDKVRNLQEYNAHLNQQISELSAKQNQEKASEQDKDWAENFLAVSDERDNLKKRLCLLQNKYNTESQAWQKEKESILKDKEGILVDHQLILQEKQAVTERSQVLSGELKELQLAIATLRQEHEGAKDAIIRLQDENLALKAQNDKLLSANADLSSDVAVLKKSYDDLSASAETNQHLQDFTSSLKNELDEKIRECDNLSRIVSGLEASVAESDALLGTARELAARQVEVSKRVLESREAALAEKQEAFLRLEADKLVLQDQHRLALEAQKADLEKNHRNDLDKVGLAQQKILTDERLRQKEAFESLNQSHQKKITDIEASLYNMCQLYEKSDRELAKVRLQLAENQVADVPVSASSHLLSGAVEHLKKIVDIFAESLAELPTDLLDSPAVKNMLAGKRSLCQLIDTLNLFSGEFQKLSPQSEELLNICQTWQEEFGRKYPSLDLYFKYPVDGSVICYKPQVRAILRELVENAAEALNDQFGAEVKVKIQLKSPEEMVKGHFKKEIDKHCLLVQVLDNNKNLFDPEQAIKPYQTNKDGHLGLGLSICRFLLEKMDGELELRSTPNGGAAVFYIPV